MAGVRRTDVITPRYEGYATHINKGYLVYKPYGSKATIHIHRELMERFVGRKLNPKETVHHLNGDKLDNRIENLSLVSINEHMSIHSKVTAKIKPRDWHGRFMITKTPRS